MSPMPPVIPRRQWPQGRSEETRVYYFRSKTRWTSSPISVTFGDEQVSISDSPWLLQWRLNRAIRRVKALHKRHQARDDKVRWVLEKASEAQGGLE